MGQPKTPGTMLQDGQIGTNVKVVLAAGTYPWSNLFIPHWPWQGLLSWNKPGGRSRRAQMLQVAHFGFLQFSANATSKVVTMPGDPFLESSFRSFALF
jgi:hypothetical protein